ncbi:unnamed protein product [Rotaria sp. Silwood1]|nr:unnamed protein product [Rotaria sp. Silwood1]CAF1636997.1 unnamed protein product [Rotaria sp. Silwood1]CAF3915482.1 unnamed protein product [Rotaria sp. Silwood1]CAF3919947.1 unnamed protein product [Rotaria sp. Silwood1]CAF4971960.1 unnamed protein product [Rotaria sp. Silwood1]
MAGYGYGVYGGPYGGMGGFGGGVIEQERIGYGPQGFGLYEQETRINRNPFTGAMSTIRENEFIPMGGAYGGRYGMGYGFRYF